MKAEEYFKKNFDQKVKQLQVQIKRYGKLIVNDVCEYLDSLKDSQIQIRNAYIDVFKGNIKDKYNLE